MPPSLQSLLTPLEAEKATPKTFKGGAVVTAFVIIIVLCVTFKLTMLA